jgi:hypothetical protein
VILEVAGLHLTKLGGSDPERGPGIFYIIRIFSSLASYAFLSAGGGDSNSMLSRSRNDQHSSSSHLILRCWIIDVCFVLFLNGE